MLSKLTSLLETYAVRATRVGALVIVVVGVAYSVLLGDELRYADERDYVSIARNLVERGEFAREAGEPTAYRPPAYPLLLAGLMAVGAPIEGMRIANFILLALCALLLSGLALQAGQRLAAALVPIGMLAYPLLPYTAGTLYPQTLAAFLICAFVYLLYATPATMTRSLGAGVALGLLILAVPLNLLLVPVLVLWSALTQRPKFRRMLIVSTVAAITTLPWLGRNYVVMDEFPLFGTNSGSNLLLGNSENTTPNSGVRADISRYRRQTETMDEVERNEFLTEEAIEYVIEHPERSAALYGAKFLNWFNVDPNLATERQQNALKIAVLAVSYAGLLGLVAARLWLARRRPLAPWESLSLFLYVAAAAAYAVFFTRIRFRVPFDTLLVLPAATALAMLLASRLRDAAENAVDRRVPLERY